MANFNYTCKNLFKYKKFKKLSAFLKADSMFKI